MRPIKGYRSLETRIIRNRDSLCQYTVLCFKLSKATLLETRFEERPGTVDENSVKFVANSIAEDSSSDKRITEGRFTLHLQCAKV